MPYLRNGTCPGLQHLYALDAVACHGTIGGREVKGQGQSEFSELSEHSGISADAEEGIWRISLIRLIRLIRAIRQISDD